MPEPLTAGAREFKTRLGSHLRQVREGRTLTITDRGRPGAKVTPADMTGQSIEARLDQLRAEGVVTGTGKPCRVSSLASCYHLKDRLGHGFLGGARYGERRRASP